MAWKSKRCLLYLTEYDTSTVNIPSIATIKIGPNDDGVIVLLDSDEDVCHGVNLSDTSYFPYKTKPSNPVVGLYRCW